MIPVLRNLKKLKKSFFGKLENILLITFSKLYKYYAQSTRYFILRVAKMKEKKEAIEEKHSQYLEELQSQKKRILKSMQIAEDIKKNQETESSEVEVDVQSKENKISSDEETEISSNEETASEQIVHEKEENDQVITKIQKFKKTSKQVDVQSKDSKIAGLEKIGSDS